MILPLKLVFSGMIIVCKVIVTINDNIPLFKKNPSSDPEKSRLESDVEFVEKPGTKSS